MKKILLSTLCATLLFSAMPSSATVNKGGIQANDAVPLEYWALPNTMNNAQVSPDGKYVAFLRSQSKKGETIIEVYKTDNLNEKPHRVGAKSLDLTGFTWISNTDMTINFQRQVSKKIKGFNQGAFRGKVARFSMNTKKFEELSDDDFELRLIDPLVNDPDRVLMRYVGVKRGESFRAPNFYKVNLDTGARELVLKGNRGKGNYTFDSDGNPRTALSRSADSSELIYWYRTPAEGGWTEFARVNRDDYEQFRPVAEVPGDKNRIYVLAHNGNDKVGLWKYNLTTKQFEDLVYRRKDVDLRNVGFHSNRWSNPDDVTNIVYTTDKVHRKFMDSDEQAIYEQFETAIPNAYQISLQSRSKDGKVIVVRNTGPKDPGSFYLYNDGDFSKLGSVNSLLKAEDLSPVEYISYKARDGKNINGYITKPKGAGPHPLIVMPHGGPFVSETPIFDEWAQLLANNGYMVLQPQYRGSTNFGLDFYKSAFIDGGEGGGKMQDDKDDGANYLVGKGLVDKDRMAMFGWSYGGYAALIAASRPSNIYQCVVAGAAVADNVQQVNYYRNNIRGSQREEQLKFWDDSINPIDEVSNVNVPMLIIHGSIDQRVPVKHSQKYVNALKKSGKDFEYLELKNADHFSNTIEYDHKMKFYPKMIDFLQNDCGPGGL